MNKGWRNTKKKKAMVETGICSVFYPEYASVRIAGYTLARMMYLDDIYNHAYIEKNYNYIKNNRMIPYKICETFAGPANDESSEKSVIDTNDKILTNLKEVLIFIAMSRKFPYCFKYEKAGDRLEYQLRQCFEEGDFSNISVPSDIDRTELDKLIDKYTSKASFDYKEKLKFVSSARTYMTKKEFDDRWDERNRPKEQENKESEQERE